MLINYLLKIIILLIALQIPEYAYSKENIPVIGGIGATVHQGYLWPHRKSLMHLDGYYPTIYQLEIYRNTKGHKSWHHHYNFPKTGFHLSYGNLKAPAIGYSIATGFFMEPFLLIGNNYSLSFRAGTGLAFVSNPYDEINNPDNHMHGSRLNGLMHGILKYTYHLSQNWDIIAGLSMSHYSNGVFKLPNAGSNIPAITLGVDYNFINRSTIYNAYDTLKYSEDLSFYAYIGGGIKLINATEAQRYPIGSMNAYISNRLSYKHSIYSGINYFQDFISSLNITDGNETINDYRRLSLILGHELHISRVSLITQAGIYFYHRHPFENIIFQRFGLKYYITPSIFATYCLVTHYGKADFIEWSLGVKL